MNWKLALIKGKKNKRMRVKIKKKKQLKIWLKDEIKREKKNFNKSVKDKIKKFKKWGPKRKTKYTKNYNWMTKLKRIKISINEKGTK